MKRYVCAALAAALLAPGLSAFAQDDAPPPPASSDHSDQQHKDNGMARRMKRLGLTDDQSAQFQDAVKAHGDAMKQQGQAVKESVKKLAEDIKAKASDDELQSALAALKAARKAMFEENEKFEAKLATFLTPTQQAKMAVGAAMMMRNRGEGGHGDRGGDDRGGDRGGPQGGDGGSPQGGDGGQ
jgi:Spy/CpxP family protein refolding chaperone